MKKIAKLLAVTLVSVVGLTSAVFGITVTKTFEFGAGTANPEYNARSFQVPCELKVSVYVKFSRRGLAGLRQDVPIIIDLMSPGTGSATQSDFGPVEDSKSATASTTPKTIALSADASQKGCPIPWIVRVKPTSGTSDLAIYGEITLTYNDSLRVLDIDYDGSPLKSGDFIEKNIIFYDNQAIAGLTQGVIEIKGYWFHDLGVMPIRMKFELINPNGDVVKTERGFPFNEVNPCCSGDKLKLTYQNPALTKGTWKLRITNISDGHKAMTVGIPLFQGIKLSTFKPKCP